MPGRHAHRILDSSSARNPHVSGKQRLRVKIENTGIYAGVGGRDQKKFGFKWDELTFLFPMVILNTMTNIHDGIIIPRSANLISHVACTRCMRPTDPQSSLLRWGRGICRLALSGLVGPDLSTAHFRTIWAEIDFYHFLQASMVMAVNSIRCPILRQYLPFNHWVGTVHQWFQRDPTDPSRHSRHPCPVASVASRCVFADHKGFLTVSWCWHVWCLHRLMFELIWFFLGL